MAKARKEDQKRIEKLKKIFVEPNDKNDELRINAMLLIASTAPTAFRGLLNLINCALLWGEPETDETIILDKTQRILMILSEGFEPKEQYFKVHN